MKNICVVQGGSFLLGIAEQDIIGRMPWAEAVPLLQQDGGAVIQLGALLLRQPGGIPAPDAVCLELRGVFLVVDQIAADNVALLNPPGPLPPACPRLAARLCPQVTIWGDTPVLLLDPAQLLPVAEELGGGIGMVAMLDDQGDLQTAPTADEVPEETAMTEEQTQPPAADKKLPEITEEEALACIDTEEQSSTESAPVEACPAEEPAPPLSPEQKKKDAAAIDEETFKKVMAWTVSCFKQRKAGEELRLGIDQLPSELAVLVQEKGLSSSIIQYLIDQIVLRCQESAGQKTPGKKHAG